MADDSGMTVSRASLRSIAGLSAFRDYDRFRAALSAEFGIDAPTTARFVQAGTITLSCVAPGRYIASSGRDASLARRLTTSLQGVAAVTDQSDLWEIFALTGPNVRELLARTIPIDLTPDRFRIGDLALTRAGHLDVRVWRTAEQDYEVAIVRSYAQDLAFALGLRS